MEKYVKVRKIGQGSYGCAYLATRKTDVKNETSKQQLVIKEIVLDPRDQVTAQREARLLAALDHPNIVACKESFLLKREPSHALAVGRAQQSPTVFCIVTEFADGGDLSQDLERRQRRRKYYEPDELLGLFVQVCLALKHLHDRKILHRDVKPANIFLTKTGVVKLGDLGVATVLSHTLASCQTSIGTPYYTAPEICLNKRYNAKADVWSLGCVLFEMASFAHVFDGRSQRQLFDNIIHGATPHVRVFGHLTSIQQDLQLLINDMLQKEPRARPSVNQVIRRPLVLARIQTFLSAHALALEMNHTVLHGEHVFRKISSRDSKPHLNVHQVRRAEPVASKPLRNARVKPRNTPVGRGALLNPNRKAVLRRSRPVPGFREPNGIVGKQRMKSKPVHQLNGLMKGKVQANEAIAALPDPPSVIPKEIEQTNVSERIAAFNSKWAIQKEELVKKLPPPAPSKIVNGLKQGQAAIRGYPKPVILRMSRKTPITRKHSSPRNPKPKTIQSRVIATPSLQRVESQRKRQVQAKKPIVACPLDDSVLLVQQLPDVKTIESLETHDEQESTSLPMMANLEFERMVLQLKSAINEDTTSEEEEENLIEDIDNSLPPPYSSSSALESLRVSILQDPSFRLALQKSLQSNILEPLNQDEAQATLHYMHTYITSLR
ncbi:putative serine/threonine-protein kinase, Ulk1/Ulk2 [Plasmopara halstedii]